MLIKLLFFFSILLFFFIFIVNDWLICIILSSFSFILLIWVYYVIFLPIYNKNNTEIILNYNPKNKQIEQNLLQIEKTEEQTNNAVIKDLPTVINQKPNDSLIVNEQFKHHKINLDKIVQKKLKKTIKILKIELTTELEELLKIQRLSFETELNKLKLHNLHIDHLNKLPNIESKLSIIENILNGIISNLNNLNNNFLQLIQKKANPPVVVNQKTTNQNENKNQKTTNQNENKNQNNNTITLKYSQMFLIVSLISLILSIISLILLFLIIKGYFPDLLLNDSKTNLENLKSNVQNESNIITTPSSDTVSNATNFSPDGAKKQIQNINKNTSQKLSILIPQIGLYTFFAILLIMQIIK